MIRKITLEDLTKEQQMRMLKSRISRVRNQPGLSKEESEELRRKFLVALQNLRK